MLSHETAAHNTLAYEHNLDHSNENNEYSKAPSVTPSISHLVHQSQSNYECRAPDKFAEKPANHDISESVAKKPQLIKPLSGIPRLTNIPRLTSITNNIPSTLCSNNSNSSVLGNGSSQLTSSKDKIRSNCSSAVMSPQSPSADYISNDGQDKRHFVRELTPRSRGKLRSDTRHNRAVSEYPCKQDGDSDTSSAFSNSGQPRVITSKIASLQNAKYKPGGGNVQIFDEKVQIGPIGSKCNSLANVKHKPGGGNVKIVNEKLDVSAVTSSKIGSLMNVKHTPTGGDKKILTHKVEFSENATSKVGSLANVKHIAAGGNVKIFNAKPEFDKVAKSKVGSLQNAKHQPTGGKVQIFNEQLPWLKYNKPNLSTEEKERINKRSTLHRNDLNTSFTSSSTGY